MMIVGKKQLLYLLRCSGLLVFFCSLFIGQVVGQVACDTCDVTEEEMSLFVLGEAELQAVSELERLGDEMMFQFAQPDEALKYYMGAYDYKKEDFDLNLKIAKCLLKSVSEQKTSAILYLERAMEINSNYDSLSLLLGMAYHLDGQWRNAIDYYQKFKLKAVETDEIEKRIYECVSGLQLSAKPANVHIQNMGPVLNSRFSDFCPLVEGSGNVLYFTSRRHEFRSDNPDIRTHLTEHIYISRKYGKRWTVPVPLQGISMAEDHNGTVSLSDNGKHMLVYQHADIMITHWEKGKWQTPKTLPMAVNSDYMETSACLNSSGDTLYFTSDRPVPEAKGGLDIYGIARDSTGRWGRPYCLSEAVNTPYDEEGVFLSKDGSRMYFSSRGHNTIGGFDVFVSVKQKDGTWGEAKNMGIPLNTPGDDIYFVLSRNERVGYYSSEQKDTYGEKDLYQVLLEPKEEMSIQLPVLKPERVTTFAFPDGTKITSSE
ncbi:hypothetical protein [Algivirga pacifica]|uniref:WD40-like Beta Propeller Repeat n=1 Tax=Algivirga pacifica TaxID=1162670 RepID=A0ABP9DJD7_9BACT